MDINMDRRDFLKTVGKTTTYIFAGGLFVPKYDIIRPADARMNPYIAGGVGLCAGDMSPAYVGDTVFARAPDDWTQYRATKFVASCAYTLKSVTVQIGVQGTFSTTVYCSLMSFTTAPSGTLASASDHVHPSGSRASYIFPFAGYTLSAGTAYAIELGSSSTGDASNYLLLGISNKTGQWLYNSNDASTWYEGTANYQITFTVGI
jgi:hypothetical protein